MGWRERDISIASQTFASTETSMEGKWFADRPEDAAQWGVRFYGDKPFHILRTNVPTRYAESLYSVWNLDNIGPARYVEDLGQFNEIHSGITELQL